MSTFKVLLVDDEEDFITTLSERLQLRDITTLVATDGDQALDIIRSESPPVVVLDVMMPGIGGIEVLQQIKRRYPETQIILLTGQGTTRDGIKAMHLGAYDFLMKPVKIEELVEKMNAAYEASKKEKE